MNDIENGPLNLLLTRRSTLVRDMTEPGPDTAAIETMLQAAARVPDHGKLAPWRFIVCQGEGRGELGEIIAASVAAEDPDKTPEMIERLRVFPLQAPTMIIVLSTPKTDSKIPVWEQHLSAGAACQNLLLAACSLGFAAQWLTGAAAYSPGVRAHLQLSESDQIAGFIFVGSPSQRPLAERPRPDMDEVCDWR